MKRPHFGGILIFFVFGLSGVRALVFFSGTPKQQTIPKKSDLGPRRGLFRQIFGDLKVAHGESATDEPKKS